MANRAFELEQDLIVDGDSFFNGEGTVQGNFQVLGNLQVSGDLVYDQEGTSDFIPIASGYTLGNTAFRWGGYFANVDVSGTTTFAGPSFFRASAAGGASFRVPHGVAPTSAINGDFWTTAAGAFLQIDNTTKRFAFSDSDITGSANNAAYLGGAAAATYRDASNLSTGTLPSGRLTGTYAISISGNAATATLATNATAATTALTANNSTNLNGQAASYYLDISNATGTLASARLTGTYGISISGNAATATLATTATSALTANNSTNLNGQAASYYNDLTNATGTLASARLTGTYGISISGTANNSTYFNGQLASYYLSLANATGTLAVARLSGSYGISITGNAATATTATTADSATTATTATNSTQLNGEAASYYTDIDARLGYTPVQQATGVGQQAGTIKIGWSAAGRLKATVNTTDLGNLVFDSQLATASVSSALTANNSTNLNGQAASYYLSAANLTGTLASARLSGTYSISVTGSAGDASNLNGQAAAYYLNATNINTGTLAAARLPASMTGKTFTSDTSVSGTFTATTLAGTSLSVATAAALPYGTTFAGSGSNGGLISIAKAATGSTLAGPIYLLQTGNVVRLYDSGTGTRGVYFDLANSAAGGSSLVWTSSNLNPSNYLGINATAANSSELNSQPGSYYLNAGNMNAGTLPSARLTGTYAISISGNAATATTSTQLNGQAASYYLSAANLTGTIADARLPSTMTGKTFSSGVAITGALTVTGDITAFSSSDRRLKMDIVPIPSALDKVKAIGGYTYTRVDSGKREAGIIAQEIQAVLPEVVIEREHGVLAVDYPKLVALLIEAIKELDDNATK